MAGAGKKTFIAGEVLTASDVNSYLMDQTVMRFASSSARSTALPSPDEGMLSYLDDTDAVEYYDGSAWLKANITTYPIHAFYSTSASVTGLAIVPGGFGGFTVTFPASRFSVGPRVVITKDKPAVDFSEWAIMSVVNRTASSCYVQAFNSGSFNIAQLTVDLMAVQMTSGSASG